MSEPAVIGLGSANWEEEAPGIRARVDYVGGERWAIVEYDAGAAREEWCTDGHRGYVLAGEIEYEFDDGRPPLRAQHGEGFVLPAGPAHCGRNVAGETTRLFLIDDPRKLY